MPGQRSRKRGVVGVEVLRGFTTRSEAVNTVPIKQHRNGTKEGQELSWGEKSQCTGQEARAGKKGNVLHGSRRDWVNIRAKLRSKRKNQKKGWPSADARERLIKKNETKDSFGRQTAKSGASRRTV